nr:trafficking protein particle complex subunit 6b-like isoform X1 [Nerophis lumbriciformis]
MADDALFEFLHMEIVAHVYRDHQSIKGEADNKRASRVSTLEAMGYRVGQGLIERLTRDSPCFKDELDIMKFICKDFWTKVFRRQVDNLRTNHQYLAFSCGVVRGALSNLGLESVVTAEVSVMPSCKFQVVIQKL